MSDRSVEFIRHDAARMVDVPDLASLDAHVDVSGAYVRLSATLTPEERAHVDVAAIAARLAERGALVVVDAMTHVRAQVSDDDTSRVGVDAGVEALRAWVRASGEDEAVRERAEEMLDELVTQ